MSDLFWLSDAQIARLEPYSPKLSHGSMTAECLSGLPKVKWLLDERGYGGGWQHAKTDAQRSSSPP